MIYKILLAISILLLIINIITYIQSKKVLRRKNITSQKQNRKISSVYKNIYSKIRNIFCKKEILVLQTYTILLIKSGLSTKEILNNLSSRTRFFKNEINEVLAMYTTDSVQAIKQLKESTKSSKEFEKIVIAIEQCLLSDRNTGLLFLTNSRNIAKELYRLKKIRNDGKKRILTTLMLALPLAACILIAGYPWFEYVMKIINEVPI